MMLWTFTKSVAAGRLFPAREALREGNADPGKVITPERPFGLQDPREVNQDRDRCFDRVLPHRSGTPKTEPAPSGLPKAPAG